VSVKKVEILYLKLYFAFYTYNYIYIKIQERIQFGNVNVSLVEVIERKIRTCSQISDLISNEIYGITIRDNNKLNLTKEY
jgi:hypothetical protein